jgi:hypothetical protein
VAHVKVTDAAEAKAAAARCHVQAARLLLEEEHVVDIERKVVTAMDRLNQRFEHVGAIIQCSSLFLNFLKFCDDLLLEEIHLDTTGPSIAPTTLHTSTTPLAPKW